ncbi:hypothetical protein X975_16856, partial [Stegodyphus mimosarum]
MTGIELELLTDLDMHLFIERGIRGGISMISHRWAEANNKYLPHYDPSKPSSYIIYLDANNLYGWAMSQPLPYGGFQWVSPSAIDIEAILSSSEDGAVGYILEVDLEYPQELHDLHNEYPLAPEKCCITTEELSPYSLSLLQKEGRTNPGNIQKLVPNLKKKQNYVLHYRNLKYYLEKGLKLTKVHKILKFLQKPWLSPYIQFNTEERKKVNTTFEKNFFKLMNNSVYGKTMENVRNRVDIQIVNNVRKAQRLVAAPSFKEFRIFDDDLVGIQRVKNVITLNRPIYVGFAILELSKLHMYEFHYDHMKRNYGSRAQLLFTDTDSLTYSVQTEDIYKDMSLHLDLYDTSEYPKEHPLYSEKNKKRIGCFKDELNGAPVQEFVGLKAKMYSLLTPCGEKKTAKGVSRTVLRKHIRHLNYKDCLFNETRSRDMQRRIASESHRLFTVECQRGCYRQETAKCSKHNATDRLVIINKNRE